MSEVPLYSRRGSPRAEAVLLGPPRDLRRGRELLLPESGGGREGEREGQRERERERGATDSEGRAREARSPGVVSLQYTNQEISSVSLQGYLAHKKSHS